MLSDYRLAYLIIANTSSYDRDTGFYFTTAIQNNYCYDVCCQSETYRIPHSIPLYIPPVEAELLS